MPDDVVKLAVGGTEFAGWDSLTIVRSMDSCADAFSLTAPFDPTEPAVASAFKPFGYQAAVVKIDDELLLTGTIEQVSPSTSESDRALNVQGRSKTGALVDCAIDGVGYQFQGLSLLQVAKKLCAPFGVEVVSAVGNGPTLKSATGSSSIAEAEKALKEASAEPGQTGFEFLNALAHDAGLMLTTNAAGKLVITKAQPGAVPVAALIEGTSPVKGVSASYDGTRRFSKYKVLQQQDGTPGIVGTAEDGSVKAYRPTIKTGSSSDAGNVTAAAKWERALALAGAVSVSVTLAGWRDPAGKLWTPGTIVSLQAPGAYILKEALFMIAEATLTLDPDQGRTSSLRLVLPATYSGEMPGGYPWD